MKSIEEVDEFIKLMLQFDRLLNDFNGLSKKSPNDAINPFKLKFVNDLLSKANQIIDKRNRPFPDFETFEEGSIPTNSDVVVMLSQYRGCLDKFRRESIQYDMSEHEHYWIINGKRSKIQAPSQLESILGD